ncbi:MAG: c-type cytochrome, partial [Pirellula sp.]
AMHGEDSDDHNLPKMIWFGLEPSVVKSTERSLALAESTKIPMLSRHIARRIGDAQQFDLLIQRIGQSTSSSQLNMLLGLRDSLEGRFDLKAPTSWPVAYDKLSKAGNETSRVALQLSQQFGDSVAAAQMLKVLEDRTANSDERIQAIRNLSGRKRLELRPLLIGLLSDEAVRREAIRAVASFEDLDLAKQLLKRYSDFSEADKQEVVSALASRSRYGTELTNAIRNGTVPKRDVPAHIARLLRRVVGNTFVDVWGPIDELGADKEALFVKYRDLLKESSIAKANASNGRAVFNRACATCHKLHGTGSSIGPDITGANRSSLEYLLSNILTPSAVIQDAYKMHVILMDDGRIFSGIPSEENDRQLKLLVADRQEPITIAISDIESRQISSVSMMPEGSLANLKDSEVLDLFTYLQSLEQHPLPK